MKNTSVSFTVFVESLSADTTSVITSHCEMQELAFQSCTVSSWGLCGTERGKCPPLSLLPSACFLVTLTVWSKLTEMSLNQIESHVVIWFGFFSKLMRKAFIIKYMCTYSKNFRANSLVCMMSDQELWREPLDHRKSFRVPFGPFPRQQLVRQTSCHALQASRLSCLSGQ